MPSQQKRFPRYVKPHGNKYQRCDTKCRICGRNGESNNKRRSPGARPKCPKCGGIVQATDA